VRAKIQFATVALGVALLMLAPAHAQGKALTVDICAGGDLHRNFGIDGIAYALNTVSVTSGGTYGSGDPSFGCHLDTSANTLGHADIEEHTYFEVFNAPIDTFYFNLTNGKIVIQGESSAGGNAANGFTDTDYVIVGGTGAYARISGVAHLQALSGPEARITFSSK
jgi:hypothetical protein